MLRILYRAIAEARMQLRFPFRLFDTSLNLSGEELLDLAAFATHPTGLTPPAVKVWTIAAYRKAHPTHSIFIETGTNEGNLMNAVHPLFKDWHTVELDVALFDKARRRLRPRGVRCYCGNSPYHLKWILYDLSKPAILWLDAHHLNGEGYNPLEDELKTLLPHCEQVRHIILIDDARLTTPGALHEIEAFRKLRYKIEMTNDIWRLIPE